MPEVINLMLSIVTGLAVSVAILLFVVRYERPLGRVLGVFFDWAERTVGRP